MKSFHQLAIGELFHTGISKGAGARSHVTNCEVIEKTSKSQGRVVKVIGDRHTLGDIRAYSARTATWDCQHILATHPEPTSKLHYKKRLQKILA